MTQELVLQDIELCKQLAPVMDRLGVEAVSSKVNPTLGRAWVIGGEKQCINLK